MKLKRTWVTAITERISGTDSKRQSWAVQQNIHGNWYGYSGRKRVVLFTSYDNCEEGAVAWLKEQLSK